MNPWRQLAIAIVMLGMLAGESIAQDQADLVGTWKGTRTWAGGETHKFTLHVMQSEKKLSGKLLWTDGTETPIDRIDFKDGELSFRIKPGSHIHYYSGKLERGQEGQPDRIKGKLAVFLVSADWEVTRAQLTSAELVGAWRFHHGALGESDSLTINADGTFHLDHRDVALGDTTTTGRWTLAGNHLLLSADRQLLDGKPVPLGGKRAERLTATLTSDGQWTLGPAARQFEKTPAKIGEPKN